MRTILTLAWALAAAAFASPAGALPNVAVIEGGMPSKWLTAMGIQHAQLKPEQLTSEGLALTQILVVPVDRVRTPAAAQGVIDFVRRGGAVVAVYWGPLVREGAQTLHPCYALAEVLGARPAGWRGTGPITVRAEPVMGRAPSADAETPVPRGILVTLQPSPEAQVLARWAPAGGRATITGGTPPTDVAVVRAGNVVYTGVDLFATANDTPAVRQLFIWMLEQFAPNLAFEQSRERSAAAMTAVIRAEEQLRRAEAQFPSVSFAPVRQLLDQARDMAAQSKQRVVQERYREAAVAVDQSGALLQQAMQLMEKLAKEQK